MQKRVPTIRPSNVLSAVRGKLKSRPNVTPNELTAYANKLLEEKGFDYQFDVCDIVKRASGPSKSRIHSYRMAETNGKRINLKFLIENPAEAQCGECFSQIPSLQVTKREILLVTEGERHRLKRPAAFMLDEAELMDEAMKRVLRTWQLPFQTVPVGISSDGKKLYVEFYPEEQLDVLVLELSDDGRVQFRPRAELKTASQTEWLRDYPKDPHNEYLSFIRFHVGNSSYIVKFTAPCA